MKRLMAWSGAVLCMAALTVSAQPTMTNADVVKLSQAGLSEDFILNAIEQQGSRLRRLGSDAAGACHLTTSLDQGHMDRRPSLAGHRAIRTYST